MAARKESFPHQAARFSFWAPIVAIGIGMVSRRFDPTAALVVGGINILLVLSGFVLGIVALFGIRKHGARGIVGYSVFGLLVSGLILAAIPLTFAAAARHRELMETKAQVDHDRVEQDVRDIVMKFPGWIGRGDGENYFVTVVSMDERAPHARELSGMFHKPAVAFSITLLNQSDGALSFDPDTVEMLLADGSYVRPLAIDDVLRSAKKDVQGAMSSFRGPHVVQPGAASTRGFAFVPPGFDWKRVLAVKVHVGRTPVAVTGKYHTSEEKRELFKSQDTQP